MSSQVFEVLVLTNTSAIIYLLVKLPVHWRIFLKCVFLQGRSCGYYHRVQKMRDQYTLQNVHKLCEAWDIEDLVKLGKEIHSCSYYAARELMQGASIVFCPYNYLLDPMIRDSVSRSWTEEVEELQTH